MEEGFVEFLVHKGCAYWRGGLKERGSNLKGAE